jgi:outer membrane murein-binding lipoprotein Lpp
MKAFVVPLVMLMLLSGCFGKDRISELNAVCSGLRAPVDNLGNVVVANANNTPGEVIIASALVATAYDGGCPRGS